MCVAVFFLFLSLLERFGVKKKRKEGNKLGGD